MTLNGKPSFDFEETKKALSSSSTSKRQAHLRSVEDKINAEAIPESAIPSVLQLLFETHSLYHDRPSRRNVQQCLKAALSKITSVDLVAGFVGAVRGEAAKPGIAISNAFVLVEWISILLQESTKLPAFWDKYGLELTVGDAQALELCVGADARSSLRESALTITRRGLRKLFSRDETRAEIIHQVVSKLTAKSSSSSSRNAVMLGVVAGVCSRNEKARVDFEEKKSDYYSYYTREIVASRSPVPSHIASALYDFFIDFSAAEDVYKEIIPLLEKAMLRAPEIVLNDLVTPLFNSLPASVDLSQALHQNLLKPILSNVKSTNATIRDGAQAAFKASILHSHDSETINKICDELINPLKSGKITAADQRAIYADMLAVLPPSKELAEKIASGIAPVAGKEANEAALNSEASLLAHTLINAIPLGLELEKTVADAFLKGLSDKKGPVRRTWALRFGDLVWVTDQEQLEKPDVLAFVETVLSAFPELLKATSSNAIAAAQSGVATASLVFTAVSQSKLAHVRSSKLEATRKKVDIVNQTMVVEPKPSFLLNHRVYSKFTSDEDFVWLSRALASLSSSVITMNASTPVAIAWSQAMIFCICSNLVKHAARQKAAEILSKIYVEHPAEISAIITAGLWFWRRSIETGEKDSAASASRTGHSNLGLIVRAICLTPKEAKQHGNDVDEVVRKKQMVSVLVIARPEILPRVNWIETCLRMAVDPGNLAREFHDEMFKQVVDMTSFYESDSSKLSESVKKAAYNAVAELAFVAPEIIISRTIKMIREDLDPVQLSDVGPEEAAIFRTPEGTAFVDVLAKKSTTFVPNKNTKDYDTLKWEEEVRAQLAQKKGQQKKLTPEETAKVKAQLAKEAGIRLKIQHLEARLLRGTGIIFSLASGPPTDAKLWMGPAVKSLIDAISAGSGLITSSPATTYIVCANLVSSRVGTMRPFIGIATLRALNVSLDDHLLQEALGDLVTRVLYRLRFAGEQRAFDTVSLTYMLPLVFLVLKDGGFGSGDDSDAQIVLALEFLRFHTEACTETQPLTRQDVLSILIFSMQKYNQHYKIIKECLSDFCRCIAPTIDQEEIAILARGSIVPQVPVRTSVLQSISADVDMSESSFSEEIWLACHDDVSENVELAHEIWEESGFELTAESVFRILPYLESIDKQLRRAAARSLAEAVKTQPATLEEVLSRLEASYQVLAKPKVPQLDEYGMPKKTDLSDPWEARNGIALAFKELSAVFKEELLDSFLKFLIEKGPLGDRDANVREEMLNAATAIITLHAKDRVQDLMSTFEQQLENGDKSTDFGDMVNEAVIILYGALGTFLVPGDASIQKVVDRLLETLSVPSETVQYAVAECLPPLVRASSDKIPEYVRLLLGKLFESKSYAERRGAAYGLAGLVNGAGIVALREYRILVTLKGAMEDKDVKYREGALLAYELLATILGRIFEPYFMQIVPQLLVSFGDSNADVREATLAASKVGISNLSSYGVKKILPTLLDGLEEQQWRSKKGACDLLGAMAYLDPSQLAQSLPEIIPPLTAVLNDSHKEVRLAANRSLKRFGEVINNPEIKSLVDILLEALSDPTKYTDTALDALIKVQFVHYLDAPSLALIVRILERGLGERSGTKRKSAQVIGSLAHLSERKDLINHLPILISGLKVAVVDAVPVTRATSAKALGSLIEKLGEDALPDLIPGLMQTLKSDTGAGDRLGSAQALSEVLAGLGTTRLEETLPTILQNVTSKKASVREGFMSLFIFLPVCFGNSFAAYLSKIIPPVLAGLADDIESIRDTALKAGRLLVKNFATKSIDLLLPELELGLADDSYRIRLSSVELVGDLLFNLTGLNPNTEEQDDEDAREAGASLLEVLGEEKRNRVLSSLYICRCDTSGLVRTAAVNVWKALVSSPKTLRELVPTLTQLIITRLGSSIAEQKTIAANALGELIRKSGDQLLSTLLPTLEAGLQDPSADVDAKQGICIALKELISAATEEAIEDHESTLVGVVRVALIDSDEEVREAAAEVFDSLQQIFGKRAVDQTLPYLLNLLQAPGEAENALSALLTLLTETTRANIILPNLIPTLTKSPITAFNAKALASLARVAPLTRRLPSIINSLMDEIINCKDDDLRTELETSLDEILLSVDEFDGLNALMSAVLALTKHEDHRRRAAIDRHLANYFAHADVDYSRYNQDIIRAMLFSFNDITEVVQAAWTALNEFTKHLKKEEMESLVFYTRQILQQSSVAGHNLPGFALPKGIQAILPIFLQGLMNGTAEQRTQSALAISDIVDRTSPESLKPFVTQITGPLIRVVSERSVEVRAAILLALNNLLGKIPTFLKPFLPQLQRTFAKSLADTSSELLRTRAAKALGTLITLTPRIDPLISELVTGARTSDAGVRNAMLRALYEVISKAGANMGETSRSAVLALIDGDIDANDDSMAITNAKLLGALIKNVSLESAAGLIKNRVMTTHFSNASVLALNSVLLESPQALTESNFAEDLPALLVKGMASKHPFIADNFVLAAGKYLLTDSPKGFEAAKSIFDQLARIMQPENPVDTRRLALVVVRTACRLDMDMVKPHVSTLAPSIFVCAKGGIIPVKLAAEQAFLALFDIVESESEVFDKYIAGPGNELPPIQQKSMKDHVKRVALRQGALARERKAAEGGAGGLGLANDEVDDEKEISSVGKVDLGEGLVFSED